MFGGPPTGAPGVGASGVAADRCGAGVTTTPGQSVVTSLLPAGGNSDGGVGPFLEGVPYCSVLVVACRCKARHKGGLQGATPAVCRRCVEPAACRVAACAGG